MGCEERNVNKRLRTYYSWKRILFNLKAEERLYLVMYVQVVYRVCERQ